MIPRNCLTTCNPPYSHGDCLRACLATILNRDDVPHLFDGRPAVECWSDIRAWLKTINRFLFIIDVDDPWDFMAENNPNIPYILLCSHGGTDHAVVCKNGLLFHNPAWQKRDISGKHSGGFWVICMIGVLD